MRLPDDDHWAAGSNTHAVIDGTEEVSQDPDLFAGDDEGGDDGDG